MIIKEFKVIEKAKNIVIGFPGVGMAGSIASEFIIHKVGFEEIGHIRSEKLPALAIIRKSKPEAPIRIYHKDGTIMIVSDIMIPDSLSHEFAKDLAKWIKIKKPKEVIMLGGSEKKEKGKVYAISWKDKYLDTVGLDHMNLGFVVGIYGPLMMELKEMDINGYLVLAEATHKPDPLAAAKIIRHVSKRIGIAVDPTSLEKESKNMNTKEKVEGKKWDPYPSIYG
ncbi:MAG: proteasome assembly chaperone family protein [Candidatus Altiarchaeota archaeon]|nr:proteasome assembly chaperone family protein [Candidatus Altiarchaeota archaeon]